MNKTVLIVSAIIIFFIIVGLRFLSGEDDWLCEGKQWVKHGNPSSAMPTTGCGIDRDNSIKLPEGYSLDNYEIKEVLNNYCQKDDECVTSGRYLMQSNCPYVSLCLKNKCAVVCPSYK